MSIPVITILTGSTKNADIFDAIGQHFFFVLVPGVQL